MITKLALTALTMGLTLSACTHEGAFKKQRAECQKLSDESERNRCLQKVESDERAYRLQHDQTRIEKNYMRKLEDMRKD